MAKNKRSLKAALHAHDIKILKQKQKQAVEAQKTTTLKGKAKVKALTTGAGRTNTVVPYSKNDTVLLVGEGDFSFAYALIHDRPTKDDISAGTSYIYPGNITATSFDSENTCFEKYPWARQTVEALKKSGVQVLFGVDATRLGSIKHLKGRKFDRLVFNFPHTGKGINDQDRNIASNQQLLVGFLAAAPAVLKHGTSNVPRITTKRKEKERKLKNEDFGVSDEDEGDVKRMQESELDEKLDEVAETANSRGTVLITLKNVVPYTLWDLPGLAKRPQVNGPRYKQLRSFSFHPGDYPGYAHRRTAGHRGEREIPVLKEKDGVTDARTWEFELV